ncbi:MAG: bifunctional folylpolyglutamate synthase/dihydrofolate synthase [Candidatus Limnocylindrus sp.]
MPEVPTDPAVVEALRREVDLARARMRRAIAQSRGPEAWAAAQVAIRARGRFGVRLGLERSVALLDALGHPERGVRGALIAGTNGKGSVSALVSAALTAGGVRHGSTPKPHLISYRERIRINGEPLAPLAFANAVDRALTAADQVENSVGPVTEFELLAGVVFDGFRSAGIDRAVVEVGLGGRLDAMHAWDGGVAVVTNVGLDHQEYLGDTIELIAREKAAIIMQGDRAVTGASERGGALRVIRERAHNVGAPLTEATHGAVRPRGRDGIEVDLPRLGPVHVGLLGQHQGENAAVALATLDAMRDAGIVTVSDAAIREGFASVKWPGRMELIRQPFGGSDARDLLLDGAHNEDGAASLAAGIRDLAPLLADADGRTGQTPLTLVIAAMSDKSITEIFRALSQAEALKRASVICTSVGDARSASVDTLAAAAREVGLGAQIRGAANPIEALDQAAAARGAVVIAGSLYLVGAVREHLMRDGRIPNDGSLDE